MIKAPSAFNIHSNVECVHCLNAWELDIVMFAAPDNCEPNMIELDWLSCLITN